MALFRQLRGVHLPYRLQGLIWFACVNFDRQDAKTKEKIRRLCKECGGEHEEALFVFLTRENVSPIWLEQTYFVSMKTLYRRRVNFFERWFE